MSVLEYGIALYRIRLKYKMYLLQNILVSLGYFIGIPLFLWTHHWSVIFLIGNLFGLPLFIFKSGILKESFKINEKLRAIVLSLTNISLGHILTSLVNNLDRFVIPVILGMSSLSVFFAANTLAKMFGLIIGPLSSVLLSHLSKLNINWTVHKLNRLTWRLMTLGIILIIPSYIISNLFMRFLYRNIFYQNPSIDWIILLSCIATCLFEVWNMLNTVYLTCLKSRFQVWINAIFLGSYLIFSLVLGNYAGLMGYTIGYTLSIIFGCLVSSIAANSKSFWKVS